MNIIASEKLELLRKRHSVRTYSHDKIPQNVREKLKAEITMTNSHVSGLRFQLIFDNSDPFRGFFKSYGTFKNPNNYLVAIIDPSFENIEEKAGYYAERFVIKCVEEKIGTCFVGGTYDPRSIDVALRAGEKISFIVLFGYEAEKQRWNEKMLVSLVHRKQFELSHFFIPSEEFESACEKIYTLKMGTEAVSIAPSAVNKRPVRIFVIEEGNSLTPCAKVEVKNYMNNIDLGIAKFNYNFVTDTQCQWGNGSPLIGGSED